MVPHHHEDPPRVLPVQLSDGRVQTGANIHDNVCAEGSRMDGNKPFEKKDIWNNQTGHGNPWL